MTDQTIIRSAVEESRENQVGYVIIEDFSFRVNMHPFLREWRNADSSNWRLSILRRTRNNFKEPSMAWNWGHVWFKIEFRGGCAEKKGHCMIIFSRKRVQENWNWIFRKRILFIVLVYSAQRERISTHLTRKALWNIKLYSTFQFPICHFVHRNSW